MTCLMAWGHRLAAMTLGHRCAACRREVWAFSLMSQMRPSAIPFWWCAPMLQKVIVWCTARTSSTNALATNLPLSQWQWRIRTLCCSARHSNACFASIVSSVVRCWCMWTYMKSLVWSTNTDAPRYLQTVGCPFAMGTKPGTGDSSWLMLTTAPGTVDGLIFGSILCVCHGFR